MGWAGGYVFGAKPYLLAHCILVVSPVLIGLGGHTVLGLLKFSSDKLLNVIHVLAKMGGGDSCVFWG